MKKISGVICIVCLVLGSYGCWEYERRHDYHGGERHEQHERDNYRNRDDHRDRDHDRRDDRDDRRDYDRDHGND